jgi:hypothetical protein
MFCTPLLNEAVSGALTEAEARLLAKMAGYAEDAYCKELGEAIVQVFEHRMFFFLRSAITFAEYALRPDMLMRDVLEAECLMGSW